MAEEEVDFIVRVGLDCDEMSQPPLQVLPAILVNADVQEILLKQTSILELSESFGDSFPVAFKATQLSTDYECLLVVLIQG